MNQSTRKSFDSGVQIAWDATSLDSFSRCPRYYYYTLIIGIKPKSSSVHLWFGGIYASALEMFYKLRAAGQSIEDAQREVVRYALEASWKDGKPMTFEDAAKTRPNLIRTIIWYIEQFGNENPDGITTLHLSNGKPAVELSFTFDLGNGILWCGHLDRVVEYGGSKYVMDQKTTGGTVGTYYFDTFSPNNQMSGYSLAGQIILDSPIRGVIIDAAQIAVNFTRFERGITNRSKQQLAEWRVGALKTISYAQHLSEEYEKTGDPAEFPMNPNACGSYGGCPYRILCSRSPGIRDSFMASDFVAHRWDPAEER